VQLPFILKIFIAAAVVDLDIHILDMPD
jgi:hypothetical protein